MATFRRCDRCEEELPDGQYQSGTYKVYKQCGNVGSQIDMCVQCELAFEAFMSMEDVRDE